MEGINIKIFTKSKDLPEMTCKNFFHSKELFSIIENTPRLTPYMVVAYDSSMHVLAHLLAHLCNRSSLFPLYFYVHGRVYGIGDYEKGIENQDKEEIFGMMLNQLTRRFRRHLCLYVEFSDITPKMFGYRFFRNNEYFPVPWQEIHNSLHNKAPKERLSEKQLRRIEKLEHLGVQSKSITTEEEFKHFYKLLHSFYQVKFSRFIPPREQFIQLWKSYKAHLLVTTYKNKIIGGCVLAFSEQDAYLWYLASQKKRYAWLHPNTIMVWNAIKYAYEHHYNHIDFIDIGAPNHSNRRRKFYLSFGGKPISKYRWFRISIPWINNLCSWWYRE